MLLPALAADLVGRNVDVIAAPTLAAALSAKNATSTIPIVFGVSADPVEQGLVASLARPRGNLTGVSFLTVELMPKRVELISELVPHAGACRRRSSPGDGRQAAHTAARYPVAGHPPRAGRVRRAL